MKKNANAAWSNLGYVAAPVLLLGIPLSYTPQVRRATQALTFQQGWTDLTNGSTSLAGGIIVTLGVFYCVNAAPAVATGIEFPYSTAYIIASELGMLIVATWFPVAGNGFANAIDWISSTAGVWARVAQLIQLIGGIVGLVQFVKWIRNFKRRQSTPSHEALEEERKQEKN